MPAFRLRPAPGAGQEAGRQVNRRAPPWRIQYRKKTPHQLLVRASLAEAANVAEREAARARNRERALKLLEAIEKSQGQPDN